MTTSTDRKGPNIKAIVIISIGVALNTALAAQMAQWSYSWFPPQASSAAPYVDDLFALETAIGSFLWFGLTAVIALIWLPVSTAEPPCT